MKLNAYSIYDRKAQIYHPPYFAHIEDDHAPAIKILTDVVSDANTSIGRHPDDFVLFHVGSYDDSRGYFETLSPIAHVADARSCYSPPGDATLEKVA
ncbi:MAG: nonstructural protein [Microvirus sp.]|nr:MAG: nonstructural protein [Microvirus sp.]